MTYSLGSSSGAQILQDDDDLYPAHINELRQSNISSFVVGLTPNCQYYCDGNADNVQIQQALDDCNTAGGGIVFLKEGSYDIEATITVYSNTTLQGVGWKTILEVAVEDECVATTNASNVILRDFAIDCNGYYSTSNVSPIEITVCSTVLVDHLYIHDTQVAINNSAAGIFGDRVINCTVKDCLVKTVTDYGISFHAALRCKIIDNFIWNPGNHGIAIMYGAYGNGDYERSKNNIISRNCIYIDTDGTDANGMKLVKSDYTTVSNNNFYSLTSTSSVGINNSDYDPASDSITNNTNYLSHNTYTGNTIYGFRLGINIIAENDSSVSGNTIFVPDKTTNGGIWVAKSVDAANTTPVNSIRISITGNVIEFNSTQATHTGIGIRLQTLTTYCTVQGNSVYYSSLYGITTDYNSNYNTIIGNLIKDSYHEAIINGSVDPSSNTGASYNIISGNMIRGSSRQTNNAEYDIWLKTASTYCTITNNQLIADAANKSNTGVYEDTSGNFNTIEGNTFLGQVTAKITKVGANTIVRNNIGHITENSGTGSIASGATTAVITHGLGVTPTVDDISITFAEQGTADYGRWWVSTITSTQFTLNVSVDPGASNLDFGWRAVVL